jgi:hypothetical protein
MLLAYIHRSITHRVHFLDKASRDLFICAKDLFVGAKHGVACHCVTAITDAVKALCRLAALAALTQDQAKSVGLEPIASPARAPANALLCLTPMCGQSAVDSASCAFPMSLQR